MNSKRMRLNEKHPFFKKLDKAFKHLEDEGIRIYIHSAGILTVVDMMDGYKEYELNDLESNGSGTHPSPNEIPPIFEYKLVYEAKETDEQSDV